MAAMRWPAAQLGFVLAIAGASMFAWLGPLSRWAEATGMAPLPFVAWRAGVGALVLGVVVALRIRRSGPSPRPPTRELGVLAVATLTGLVLNLAIFGAFARVPIAIGLLGLYTYPAMVAGVAIVTGNESPSGGTLIALVLALAGMAVVVAGGLDAAAGIAIDPIGVALALVAAASQTVFVTISRRGYPTVPADQAMAVILGGSFVGCVVIGLVTGEASQLGMAFGQPTLLAILLVAGSFGAAVPSLFFLGAIRLIGGMRTGILMLFEPVVAVTLAAILLHESLRPIQVLGAIGVLGAALVLRRTSSGEPDGRLAADDDLLGVGVSGRP
jgi:drug/metabolite transporter (DMT)-like permease